MVILTGGIAAGKTTVSDRFVELGVPVLDTDQISRALVSAGSPGLRAVIEAFGPRILGDDGSLNRKALRDIVFNNPEDRGRLESILHPLIEAEVHQQVRALRDTPYCVVVVPLLIETGLFPEADYVVVADVPEDVQRSRLKQRDGLPDKTIQQIMGAQASRSERLARADKVLDNTATVAALSKQVDSLHAELLRRFRQP
jgi:dephospho-CoA kinase